jgi:hypothetical protein
MYWMQCFAEDPDCAYWHSLQSHIGTGYNPITKFKNRLLTSCLAFLASTADTSAEVQDELKRRKENKCPARKTWCAIPIATVMCAACVTRCAWRHAPRPTFPLVGVTQPKAWFACRGRQPSQAAVLRCLQENMQLCCSCAPLRTGNHHWLTEVVKRLSETVPNSEGTATRAAPAKTLSTRQLPLAAMSWQVRQALPSWFGRV